MTSHRMDVTDDPATFDARVDSDECDGLGLMHFAYGAAVTIRSAALETFACIHVPLSGGMHVDHRGQQIVADQRTAAVFSAEGEMTMRWRSDLHLLVLKLDRADLERRLRSLVGDPPREPLTFDLAAPLVGRGAPLAGVVQLVRHALRSSGPAGPSPVLRAELKNMIMTGLLLGHRHSCTEAIYAPRPRPSPRALRRALALIHESPEAPLTLAALAERAACSERSLHDLFHRQFGVSPMSYVRRTRLEQARQQLLALDPGGSATVAEIALRHGFGHPGRFAAAYRDRFGELPSETVGRGGS